MEIRLPLEQEILTLDPAQASDAMSRRITGQLYDTLLDWDPYGGGLVPELLAEAPTLDAAGTTMSLRLRAGADARRFAADPCLRDPGGRAVEAEDVILTLLRHSDPGLAGAWGLLAGRIVGLDRWRERWKTRAGGPEGLTIDPETGAIVLRLTRAQPELPAILANPQLAIVPRECVDYYDGRDAEHPPFSRHPVGSGPYRLDHAASDLPRAAVLVRNDAGGPRPYPQPPEGPARCDRVATFERVILEHLSTSELALRLFQSGELGAIALDQAIFPAVIDGGELRPEIAASGARLLRFPVAATTLLVFRMDDPALGQSPDVAVDRRHRALRQAIAEAFDVGRYRAVLRNDAWSRPASQLTPRSIFDPGEGVRLHAHAPPSAQTARAIELVQETGLRGQPRITLRYSTTTGPQAQQEAAILREALRPLGVELEVIHDDGYLGKLAGSQLFALRFDADYPDAENLLAPFVCGDPGSYTAYCSQDYDRRFAALASLPAGPARDAEIAALERILGDDVPVRPIDEPELWLLARGDLGNVRRHPLTGLRIELLCPRDGAGLTPSGR